MPIKKPVSIAETSVIKTKVDGKRTILQTRCVIYSVFNDTWKEKELNLCLENEVLGRSGGVNDVCMEEWN